MNIMRWAASQLLLCQEEPEIKIHAQGGMSVMSDNLTSDTPEKENK